MERNINKPYKGLHTDNNPSEQPKDSYRFALNTINETLVGNQTSLSNEPSNYSCTNIPSGFTIIGDKYIEDNESVLFLLNTITGREEIGLLRKDNVYETIVNTSVLGFRITNQIDCTYRLRRGNEKVIYWVDGHNKPRNFNLSKIQDYYSQAYQTYLQGGGNPNTYLGEKWDVNSFNLIKSYTKIPYFSDLEVLDYGAIKPGSYNFAIQYIDEDLNPTEWINVSNIVNIYNDSLANSYETIRGSYDLHDFQKFPLANKSIKLSLSNLDRSYPYYRIAIIQANVGTGKVNKVLLADKQSIDIPTFIYSGNDSTLAEINQAEIKIEKENILKPQHIEQLENRLLLANTEGLAYNWCEFQKYASKIDSDLTTKDVILNNLQSEANVKNGKSTFFFRGYMPGDVYSFGIMYIMKDNSLSPVFHIPGKSVNNTGSTMDVYETNYIYPDIHNCITNDYWGKDVMGNTLLGDKVRHHKFPLRQTSGIPLINSVNTVSIFKRYRLKLKLTLKAGQTYPTDVNGDPIIISYQSNYQLQGNPVTNQLGTFSQSLLGTYIDILDTVSDVPNYVIQLYPPDYFNLDPACDLMVNYMVLGSEVFNIEYKYEELPDNTVYNVTTSKIYGIEFSNITKPHPDVIGFYIVRNEVFDDDKLIVDNAIVGPNIKENEYRAFTQITPAFPSTKLDDKSVWFFSPEVNFNQKLLQFNNMDVQGYYETSYINTPANTFYATDKDGESLDKDPIPGVYIEDVQVGTSYDKTVHKKREKDSDGFSLQCGYKNSMFNYYHNTLPIGKVSNTFTLSAAHNKLINNTNYFNVSIDNRISMVEFSNTYSPAIFKNPANTFTLSMGNATIYNLPASRLLYTALRRGYYDANGQFKDMDFAYQDYLSRPFYKEHMRPVYFSGNNTYNSFKVFNGDVQISGLNFITSFFRQAKVQGRRNKVSWWKYVVGAVLIVVGAVLAYFSAGTSLALVGIGAGLMVASIGIAAINSGIKMDKAIAMFDEHYSKGLIKCVDDFVVLTQEEIEIGDDCLQWFSDRASNLYIESRVPFGLRSGNTEAIPDFVNAPASWNDSVHYNYLVEKLTSFDREQNGGRLYRGFATAEVYNVNPDYSRFNKEKSYIHLPVEYDCCNDDVSLEKFPTRIWYSQQSFQEEKTDNYRAFLPNNYRDIEGENGEITDLHKIGNSLFIHTREALWQLPQNVQERANIELISFIGTGEFFNIPPRKIVDDSLGSGGTQHKWSKVKTKFGTLFINEIENKVYLQSEGLKDLTTDGNRNWFEGNLKSNLVQQIYDLTGVDYPYDNNPANPLGVGYLSCYDTRFERVLFTKKDWAIINPQSVWINEVPNQGNLEGAELVYNIETNRFEVWSATQVTLVDNFENFPQFFENKSWTLSYSFNTGTWVSYHSYLPNYYIHNQSNFYSYIVNNNNIWKHNVEGSYQTFYGKHYPHIIEYVSVSNPIETRIFEDVMIISEARKYDSTTKQYVDVEDITHNKIILYNSKQSSGEMNMINKDIQGGGANYYFTQVANNTGDILIDRNERTWSINQLRDYVVDYTKPLFTKSWSQLQSQYYIDKVPNNVTDFNKNWNELQSFRDKYLVIRLKFDNFADINLTTQFSLEGEEKSER